MKLAMQYAILKIVAVFNLKGVLTSKGFNFKKSKFNVSYANYRIFLRRFHRWKKKNPQKRTNGLFSRFFAGELQFHVRKEPQNDPKIVEKSFGS